MSGAHSKAGFDAWTLVPPPLRRKLQSEPGRRFLRFVPVSLAALASSQITLALLIGVAHISAGVAADNYFRPLGATREDEAIGAVTGAYMAGLRGVVLMQTSGFALIANALASLAVPYQIPTIMVISERGTMGEFNIGQSLVARTMRPTLDALGYRLIGGRLLATEQGGAAALFMYEDAQGQRLSLVLRPMTRVLLAARTGMRRGTVNGCAWIANGMGYAVMASLPDDELDRVADQVRQEVGRAS